MKTKSKNQKWKQWSKQFSSKILNDFWHWLISKFRHFLLYTWKQQIIQKSFDEKLHLIQKFRFLKSMHRRDLFKFRKYCWKFNIKSNSTWTFESFIAFIQTNWLFFVFWILYWLIFFITICKIRDRKWFNQFCNQIKYLQFYLKFWMTFSNKKNEMSICTMKNSKYFKIQNNIFSTFLSFCEINAIKKFNI